MCAVRAETLLRVCSVTTLLSRAAEKRAWTQNETTLVLGSALSFNLCNLKKKENTRNPPREEQEWGKACCPRNPLASESLSILLFSSQGLRNSTHEIPPHTPVVLKQVPEKYKF
jgi:hypothetical protein